MRTARRIQIVSIVIGLLSWVVHGLVEDVFGRSAPLWRLVLGDVSVAELGMRLSIVLLFVGFGVLTARIVLQRERAEEQRRRLADLLNLLLESTDEGIYGVDREGRCTLINKSAAAMLGYEPEDLIGKDMHKMIHHSRADGSPYPEDECPTHRVMKTGAGVRIENQVVWRRDGTFFPVEFSSYPMMEGNAVTGAVVTITDITERKEVEEALQKEYEHERTIAETLQTSFLPPITLKIDGFGVHQRYKAAMREAQVGGDFYDVYRLDDNRVAIVIGDVSGKGLKAALHTAMAKYMLRAYVYENPEPGQAIESLDRALSEYIPEESFITIFYGVLDPVTRTFTYANAGHEPPVVYRRASGDADLLDVTGCALGLRLGCIYGQRSIEFGAGDALLMYTDGITDARRRDQFFGVERLTDTLVANGARDEREIANAVFDTVASFSEGALRDDAVALVLKAKDDRRRIR